MASIASIKIFIIITRVIDVEIGSTRIKNIILVVISIVTDIYLYILKIRQLFSVT